MAASGGEVKFSSRQARKCAAVSKILVREEAKIRFKKVERIWKKKIEDRTPSENEILKDAKDDVALLEKRAKLRDQKQERDLEVEDAPDVLEDKCTRLADAIAAANRVVVYTGAGISTAASIPDYRGPNGVWTLLKKGKAIAPQDLSDAEPTLTHMTLVELYRHGYINYVVSQNCDGLHLRSGLPRTKLSEVHGNMFIEMCTACQPPREYIRLFDVTEKTARHRHKTRRMCKKCRSPLRDTIIHFGEKGPLRGPPYNWMKARTAADTTDMILCLGSSLKVLRKYQELWAMNKPKPERPLVYIVNLQWTPKDDTAALKINGRCDEVMGRVARRLGVEVPSYDSAQDPLFYLFAPLTKKEVTTTTKKILTVPANFAAPPRVARRRRRQLPDSEIACKVSRRELDQVSGVILGSSDVDCNIKLESEIETDVIKVKTENDNGIGEEIYSGDIPSLPDHTYAHRLIEPGLIIRDEKMEHSSCLSSLKEGQLSSDLITTEVVDEVAGCQSQSNFSVLALPAFVPVQSSILSTMDPTNGSSLEPSVTEAPLEAEMEPKADDPIVDGYPIVDGSVKSEANDATEETDDNILSNEPAIDSSEVPTAEVPESQENTNEHATIDRPEDDEAIIPKDGKAVEPEDDKSVSETTASNTKSTPVPVSSHPVTSTPMATGTVPRTRTHTSTPTSLHTNYASPKVVLPTVRPVVPMVALSNGTRIPMAMSGVSQLSQFSPGGAILTANGMFVPNAANMPGMVGGMLAGHMGSPAMHPGMGQLSHENQFLHPLLTHTGALLQSGLVQGLPNAHQVGGMTVPMVQPMMQRLPIVSSQPLPASVMGPGCHLHTLQYMPQFISDPSLMQRQMMSMASMQGHLGQHMVHMLNPAYSQMLGAGSVNSILAQQMQRAVRTTQYVQPRVSQGLPMAVSLASHATHTRHNRFAAHTTAANERLASYANSAEQNSRPSTATEQVTMPTCIAEQNAKESIAAQGSAQSCDTADLTHDADSGPVDSDVGTESGPVDSGVDYSLFGPIGMQAVTDTSPSSGLPEESFLEAGLPIASGSDSGLPGPVERTRSTESRSSSSPDSARSTDSPSQSAPGWFGKGLRVRKKRQSKS